LQCLNTPIKHYSTKKLTKNTIQFENSQMQQLNTAKDTKEKHLSSQECSCHTKTINSKCEKLCWFLKTIVILSHSGFLSKKLSSNLLKISENLIQIEGITQNALCWALKTCQSKIVKNLTNWFWNLTCWILVCNTNFFKTFWKWYFHLNLSKRNATNS